MKTFPIDDMRRKSGEILNNVLIDKAVGITHRDRPPMILVLKDHYEHLQERAAKSGAK